MTADQAFETMKLFRFVSVGNYGDQLKLDADGMLSYEEFQQIENLLNEFVNVAQKWYNEEITDVELDSNDV